MSEADAAGEPVLVLGGGSNVVVADEGFPGTVVEVATRGIEPDLDDDVEASCSGATVKVAAGEPWDPFVTLATERRWAGIEALAGIPGYVGATPIQNVGAYGQEVSQTIASVRVWDRRLRGVRTFAAADCGFGYRTSRFKQDPDRHVVLDVTFQLPLGTYGPPIEYAELARTLNLEVGERALIGSVREAVLTLRSRKGMVLDAERPRHLERRLVLHQPGAPSERGPRRRAGVAAARRIRQDERGLADRARGLRARATATSDVALSTKHTLALTNRGGATHRQTSSRSPARSATAYARSSASPSSTSPSSSDRSCSCRIGGRPFVVLVRATPLTREAHIMREIIVTEFISLDGVVEAPGGEEGFKHTGWTVDIDARRHDVRLQVRGDRGRRGARHGTPDLRRLLGGLARPGRRLRRPLQHHAEVRRLHHAQRPDLEQHPGPRQRRRARGAQGRRRRPAARAGQRRRWRRACTTPGWSTSGG